MITRILVIRPPIVAIGPSIVVVVIVVSGSVVVVTVPVLVVVVVVFVTGCASSQFLDQKKQSRN